VSVSAAPSQIKIGTKRGRDAHYKPRRHGLYIFEGAHRCAVGRWPIYFRIRRHRREGRRTREQGHTGSHGSQVSA
jgi:hypothetical protein